MNVAENNQSNFLVWSLTDFQSNPGIWQKAQVKLVTSRHYRVFIEAILGNDQKNFIGI